MLGWLILGGIVGAALASSGDGTTDYGKKVPRSYKRCNRCGDDDVSVYVVSRGSNYVKLQFVCRNCGRSWIKKYFYD